MKPIFQLSGNSRVISLNAFEVGSGMLVAGGIRDDGFTAGEIGELEANFKKASDTAQRWQSARTYDFDSADLERRLGEAEEQLEDRDFAAFGSALQSIIEWIIEGADFTKLDADAHVGRRAIALFWTLNPDYFEGVFLTALAKRLGLHKAILNAQAAEARRKFGIKNRGQAHGWNFGKAEPKPTPKGGALAEAAMSQLKARLFRSSPTKKVNGG